jgi:hypothetical protein
MLYSFCATRVVCFGWMLPWQLLLAHPPGPLYFPTGLLCGQVVEKNARHTTTCHAGLARLCIASGVGKNPRTIFRSGFALYTYSIQRNQLTVWYARCTWVQVPWSPRRSKIGIPRRESLTIRFLQLLPL